MNTIIVSLVQRIRQVHNTKVFQIKKVIKLLFKKFLINSLSK
jgi:hypothetical protein